MASDGTVAGTAKGRRGVDVKGVAESRGFQSFRGRGSIGLIGWREERPRSTLLLRVDEADGTLVLDAHNGVLQRF